MSELGEPTVEAGGRPLEVTGGISLLEVDGLPLEGPEPGRPPPCERATAVGGGRVTVGTAWGMWERRYLMKKSQSSPKNNLS